MTPESLPGKANSHRRPGFTIIELLVVIAVIGLLIALLLPAVQSAREAARRTQCKNNLKQIGLALHSYHDTHLVFPYASNASYPAASRFSVDKQTWTQFVLPFLEQQPLYEQVNFSQPVDAGPNRALFEGRLLRIFACPTNPNSDTFTTLDGGYFSDWGVTDLYPGGGPIQGLAYPLCAGSILPDLLPPDCTAGQNSYCVSESPDAAGQISWWHAQSARNPGLFNRGVTRTRIADARDGASNTIAAGERNAEECCLGGAFSWNAPIFFTGQKINSPTRDSDPSHYSHNCGSSSHHPGGAHFLFADGAVRFLGSSIDFRTYCYLGDKADGNVVSIPID